jgi:BioD-like phosphotransacetylase family protein
LDSDIEMKNTRNIFVAATGQNVGKTTTCLGLYDKLLKSGLKSGFIKPVGQRYLRVEDINIDEDSYLIHKIYKFDCPLKDMNPVAVPPGFTQEYIDAEKPENLMQSICASYDIVQKDQDFVLIEGTGHAGVGSVFDASNSLVAKALQSKVIIVTDGGIGKAIDSLILNKCLFDLAGVELLGVIVNKVHWEKLEKINDYVEKSLRKKGIKLLGVIPFKDQLMNPNMEQIREVLNAEYITAMDSRNHHVANIIVGAMSVPNMLRDIKSQTLVITPGDREDLILAALSWNLSGTSRASQISGLVVTGNVRPGKFVKGFMKKSSFPIIFTKNDTFKTASIVHDLKAKIKVTDVDKIKLSQQLFEQYVDFDYIMEHC